MNETTVFRGLIVAALTCGISGSGVDLIIPGLVPTALEDALQAHRADDTATEMTLALTGFVLLESVCALAGMVGLFLFKHWGRRLSAWTSILTLTAYPFLGPFLSSGWGTLLNDASMMFWGAALAMAYFSPIHARFTRRGARLAAPATRA